MLSHRTGRREIAVYDRADPDACSTVLHLSADDTRTLAELLGGSPVSEAVTGVQRLEGVAIDWIRIRRWLRRRRRTRSETAGSEPAPAPRSSRSCGATRRCAAPGPEVVLESDDLVVAVGTPDGLRQLRELLEA